MGETPTTLSEPADLAREMRQVADDALRIAGNVSLLFVTNLQSGEITDIGPEGIVNEAQYYTRGQADEIIRSLHSLGVTVHSFFNELDFLSYVLAGHHDNRHTVVFTTAEGGQGSGRRALIPAVCNLLSLPVLNSGAHACSIARHKFHANAVLARIGIRVPTSWAFSGDGWLGEIRPPTGSRVILKPTYESACIGVASDSVRIVDDAFEDFVIAKQAAYGQPVVVQEFISGEEVGVPIVKIGATHALPPVAFRRSNGTSYGTEPKTFLNENVDHDISHVMFDADTSQYTALQKAAVTAFDALEMRGVGRIDLRVDIDGRAFVFDTNESPPPLAGTAYAVAMESLGFSVVEMLAVWLGICFRDYGII